MNLEAARQLLTTTFGFAAFREGQEEVVARLLDGRSVVAIFPTGAGKSICYQLPALALDGLTVVVSPLIALMKDQLDFLKRHGVPAARLDSTLDVGEARRVQEALRSGALRLLYVAPERFASERFRETLRRHPPRLLAVDEAHCISEWGHNFRPDYMKLARLARELGVERVLALTATATPEVARDIALAFGVRDEDVVRTGFHRPNLHLEADWSSGDRMERLVARLTTRGPEAAIVYVSLQRTAEQVAETLAARGFPARCYHAGLEDGERHAVQDWFMASHDGIVVATIAFGMGVDKSDIRAVYHYNLPRSLESYAQEIGRAGRDGRPAWCELLAAPDDVITLENFSYGDTPDRATLTSLLATLFAGDDDLLVSPYDLSTRHDVRPLVLDTIFTYLEMENLIEATGAIYTEYKLRFHATPAKAKTGLSAESAQFLDRVLAAASEGREWFTLDVDAALAKLGVERGAVVALLADLEERGHIELRTSGLRRGYRRLRAPGPREALVDLLHGRFHEREARDIARSAGVLELVKARGCLTAHLVAHFGEVLEACGHCARCAGRAATATPARVAAGLTQSEQASVGDLVSEAHPALQRPRQLARFLCGLTSPATTRAKLSRDKRFGALSRLHFPELLRAAEEMLG